MKAKKATWPAAHDVVILVPSGNLGILDSWDGRKIDRYGVNWTCLLTVCKDNVRHREEAVMQIGLHSRIDMTRCRLLHADGNHGDHDGGKDTDKGCVELENMKLTDQFLNGQKRTIV